VSAQLTRTKVLLVRIAMVGRASATLTSIAPCAAIRAFPRVPARESRESIEEVSPLDAPRGSMTHLDMAASKV
jgi:hypothetical protein